MKSCRKLFLHAALMCVALAFAQLAPSAFADSTGDTILSYTCGTEMPDSPVLFDVRYGRLIRLQHNGSANGTLIATFNDWPDYFPIYKSLDDGVTWKQISWPTLLTTNWQVRVEPDLFELPIAAGDLPAGTIMLAGNSYELTNNNSHRMEIWCSTNQGVNWQFRGVADTSTNQGMWEPRLDMSSAGQLVCFYSDERFQTNGYSQLIGERVSPDGGLTWGPEIYVVAVPDGVKRPGMAVTTKLPNGQYVLSYEGVDYGGWSQVYLKFSSDGTNWGSPTDIGTPVQTASGAYPGAVPYITWCPAGGSNGTLVISSGFSINTPNADRELYINTNLGQGYWTMIPAPVQWQGGSPPAGYSQGLLPTADGQGVIQMASSQITINGNTNLNEMLVGREQLILPGKTYTLVNQNSGLALENPGNSATPGVGLQQGVFDNSAAQQWTFNDLGNNVWTVVNRGNQLAWDDTGSNTNAGTTLEQSNSNGLAAQQFKLRPIGNGCWNFINVNSGLSVAVTNASTSAGAPIVLCTTATNTEQNWFPSQSNSNGTAAPTGLSATGGNWVVNLHWTQSTSPGITGNNVYRSTAASGVPYTLIAKLGTTTSWSDAAVAAGTTYYYYVTAVNANGESALSAAAGATTAAAVLSTTEEFAYPAGTENLSGQNGGRGFGSAWNTAGSVVSPGLSYSSLVVASNAASLSNENAFRPLVSNYDVTNMGTVWISILMQRTDTGTQWGGLSLFSGSTTEKFFMGATGGNYGFTSYAAPGVSQYNGPASSQGATTFLVYQLQSNGTNVTVNFYANPALGNTPPTPTDTAVSGDFTFDTIRLGTSGNFKFDEIRLGDSWANVVPISSITPASPTGLSATGGNLAVNLNWTQSASPGIAGNNVYRSTTGSGGPYNLLASLPATTSYSDTAVNAGSTYYYSVTAVNFNGESALSTYASITTVPSVPTALQHYWTLDNNTYSWSAYTGYQDTGAAADPANLSYGGVNLDTGSQILGAGAANFTNTDGTSFLGNDNSLSSSLDPSNITFAVWVKRTGDWGTGEHTIVAAKPWTAYDGNGWYVTTQDGGTNLQVVLDGTQSFQYDTGSQIFPLNTWVHVAMTFSTTTKERALYINGVSVATVVPSGWTTPNSITALTPAFRLGHNMYWTGASVGLGELDDAGIWNTNLSAVRVKALYNLSTTGALAYGQNSAAALFSGYDTGTADDNVADATVGGTPWYKVSGGIGGNDGDVVAVGGGLYAVNLGGGAGMTQLQPGSVPSAPTGLNAAASATQISLFWNGTSNTTSYFVKRSTTNGGPYAVIASSSVTNFADTAVANGLSYYYVVSATSAAGESANSPQAGATMPRVMLAVGLQTNGQFTLQFQGANDQSFVVESSTNLSSWTPLATNTTAGGMFNFTDINATNHVQFYRVRE